MSIGDLPTIEADPWVRFDMYADMAREHALAGVETAGDGDDPTAVAKAHGWAADVFRDLACACVPKARRPENRP